MCLEQKIEALTKAIEANTEALLNAPQQLELPLGDPETEETQDKEDQPTYTKDDVLNALTDLRDKKGSSAAKNVLQKLGFSKLSDVPEDKYSEIMRKVA